MNSIENIFISNSYEGLLHACAERLPSIGQKIIYDGAGQATSLQIALSGNGATITGTLSATDLTINGLKYPKSSVSVGAIMVQGSNNQLNLIEKLPNTYLEDLSPNPSGTYQKSQIKSLTVNSKGIVTDVTTEANVLYITDESPYAINTIYKNTSGKTWLVIAMYSNANDVIMRALIGPDDTTSIKIAESIIVSDGVTQSSDTLTFVVPPDFHFRVSCVGNYVDLYSRVTVVELN